MQISNMKMTVTLEEEEVKEIIRQHVANELNRPVYTTDVQINVGTKTQGDQRDSWTVAIFKNVTIDVKGT